MKRVKARDIVLGDGIWLPPQETSVWTIRTIELDGNAGLVIVVNDSYYYPGNADVYVRESLLGRSM